MKKLVLLSAFISSLLLPKNSFAEPFIGEIRWVGFNFAPRGWAACDGQILAIAQNQALFSLLGTQYGGDGRTTFALPDLRGRVMVHEGAGAGLSAKQIGEKSGVEEVVLTANQIPSHSHTLVASNDIADQPLAEGNQLASKLRTNVYVSDPASSSALAAESIGETGGGQAHTNMQPYTVLNCIIALEGVFPSRN